MLAEDSTRRGDVTSRILEGATEVFASTFYHKAGMREIARRAGIGSATIYEYFPAKQDLLLAVIARGFKRLTEHLQRRLQGIDSPVEKMREFTCGFLQFYQENRVFARLMYYTVPIIAWRGSDCFELARQHGRLFAQIIAEGQERGNFRTDIDLRVVSSNYFGGLERLIVRWEGSGWELSLLDMAQDYFEAIFRGVGTPDEIRSVVRRTSDGKL